MDLSQIKMVVTDMDGTLLNSKHEVSDRFLALFHKLKDRGIRFTAASGRQYNSIVDKLHAIRDEIIVVAENGALVREGSRELFTTPLSNDLKNTLLSKIGDIEGSHAMLCGKYKAYFDGKSAVFLDELKEYYSSFDVYDSLNQVTDEIVKIAVYHNEDAEAFIYPEVRDLEHLVKVKVSGKHWVDINQVDAHKGQALEKLMQRYGLYPNEVLVFGDYNNDLEMLALADHSFAMKNAHPNVKKVAKYETASHDDFGVERILEQLLETLERD
ncbi:MAG: HAD family hydrolase [Bacteroidota bacterium]